MHQLTTRTRAESYLAARSYAGQAQLATFLARQPRVLPTAPTRPAERHAYRLSISALRVIAILLVLALGTLYFLLFGEERPERVRPDLTPAQRAKAFRLPG